MITNNLESYAAIYYVVVHICEMYNLNVLERTEESTFEDWCEGGEIFEGLPHSELSAKFMKELAPYVDTLTKEIFKRING